MDFYGFLDEESDTEPKKRDHKSDKKKKNIQCIVM